MTSGSHMTLGELEIAKAAGITALARRAQAAESLASTLRGENERLRADAIRYRYLRDHRGYHYGISMAEPSPAEWGIEWQYQQVKPGEHLLSTDDLIDQDIAALDEEDRAALKSSGEGDG